MLHEFSRTEMVIGTDALNLLRKSHVTIIGVGGVGSFVAEGLARSGVGNFTLVDDDDICLTNINRQIHALRNTVGQSKVKVMKERIQLINNKANVESFKELYNSDSAERILDVDSDYIIDAIDMVSAKLDLIERCKKYNKAVISCLGTGNKIDPTLLEITDISKTFNCPLAKVMRKELRRRGINNLKVLFSPEEKRKPIAIDGDCKTNCICPNKDRTCVIRHEIPGSMSFVPSVAGMIIASEVIKDLLDI